MVEIERALRSLGERPERAPKPVEELERRVLTRHRRRARQRMAAGAALLALLASLPVLAIRRDGGDAVVETGPVDRPPAPVVTEPARPLTVEADVPSGWQTLVADGDRLVLGTRPLDGRDLLLAVLARDDAAFAAFPSDGVVFVVGRDRLTAKYTMGEVGRSVSNGVEIIQGGIVAGPGPANALGPEKMLAGGVRVRRGDVPQSSVWLAAYAGVFAPQDAVLQAEAIAASVRLKRQTVPPPPPGSRPGFDAGQPDVPEDRLKTVATAEVNGVRTSLHTADGCAVVRMGLSSQPVAGGCADRPEDEGGVVSVAATSTPTLPPLPGPPGSPPSPGTSAGEVSRNDRVMVVVARAGAGVRTVKAVLVDGGTLNAAVDPDGWVLVATVGRVYLLEGYDAKGGVTGQVAVN